MRTLLQRYFVAVSMQKRRSISQVTCFLVKSKKINVKYEESENPAPFDLCRPIVNSNNQNQLREAHGVCFIYS